MSKIINGIFERFKGKFTKKIYNPKLINLRLIKLCDSVELERSKLNPLIKGLLVDESKGQHEQIDLNLNSLYNKEENKILNTIFNCHIYNNSWYDYFKSKIFGNSLFSNKTSKNKNDKEKKLNFIFNCTGQLMAFINSEGDIIILNIENNESFTIKSNTISSEGIFSFNWDLINPSKLFYSSRNILYESLLNLQEGKLYINKYYILSSNNFINCFPSPKGDLIILLYKNSIEIYDIFHEIIFSKKFMTFNFINGLYDNKSSLFITFTENNLILFNLKNLEFLVISEFPGKIIKIISSSENENIFIFILNESNKLFMYTLTDISISSDIKINFNSYQNYDAFYRHQNYVLSSEVFGFEYKLMICNNRILDINFSPKEERLGILYEEIIQENIKQNSLYIYSIIKDKNDNSIDKILPLYNFGHLDDNNSQIWTFGFDKIMNKGNSFMVVRFGNDNFIKTNNNFGYN